MKKIKFYLISFFTIACLSSNTYSQKVGSTSMQFLKVMPCARATALGDAYTVWASGAEAVFWNPAGVASVQNSELSFTYIQWIFDTQQGAVAFATSLGSFGAIGLQLQYVDFGEIPEAIWGAPYNNNLDYPGLTGRTFRPFSYLAGLSYASNITDRFSTGLSVKYAHESLYNGSTARVMVVNDADTSYADVNTWANGLLFDYGIHYKTGFRTIEIAASVQNFGANVKYASESSPVPMALRVGIAADLMGKDALLFASESSRLGLAFDLFQPNDYAQQAHAGMEYEFEKIIAIRVGYKFNYDADGFTAGIGLKQLVGSTRISFDYSFGTLSYYLGNVHRISLGVGF